MPLCLTRERPQACHSVDQRAARRHRTYRNRRSWARRRQRVHKLRHSTLEQVFGRRVCIQSKPLGHRQQRRCAVRAATERLPSHANTNRLCAGCRAVQSAADGMHAGCSRNWPIRAQRAASARSGRRPPVRRGKPPRQRRAGAATE